MSLGYNGKFHPAKVSHRMGRVIRYHGTCFLQAPSLALFLLLDLPIPVAVRPCEKRRKSPTELGKLLVSKMVLCFPIFPCDDHHRFGDKMEDPYGYSWRWWWRERYG